MEVRFSSEKQAFIFFFAAIFLYFPFIFPLSAISCSSRSCCGLIAEMVVLLLR